ncbi:MAG: hypothetical protein GX126_16245 [Bacteroidales bacterium]|nr:hypothetical protein [Bacteroidales bacterium]
MAAFDFDDFSELNTHHKILSEGLEIFEKLFGFKPKSFIAPNYTWHPSIEPTLSNYGIKYLQGANIQKIPAGDKLKIKRHVLGSKNRNNLWHITRNVLFEPALNTNKDWITSCLKEIEIAFFWKKPAVISSHRVNYIGFINEDNRKRNLFALNELLENIIKLYPDAEFMTSADLGELICQTKRP